MNKNKIKNYIYKLILLLILCIILMGIYFGYLYYEDKNIILKMTIFHTDVYYFTVNKNGTYKVVYGERNHEHFEQMLYMKIGSKKNSKVLTEDEFLTLISLADEIDKSKINTKNHIIVFDAYALEIWYNDKIYSMVFGQHNENEFIKKLVEEIMNLSPIDIDLTL